MQHLMGRLFKYSIFALFIIINFVIFVFCARINLYRGVTLDEARYIPAGVSHWYTGEFGLANDCPPLARMMAVLPLLSLGVVVEDQGLQNHDGDAGLNSRDRELAHGGRFLSHNPRWFMLFCLARMSGFLWWLLGAWVIFRWSRELYGGGAGFLGLALWCFSPNVLAHEHLATPGLPAAAACAAATYAFRGYLNSPSWGRALGAGFLLGVAQLVAFESFALFVIWPLLALVHRLARVGGASPEFGLRTRVIQAVGAVALSIWVLNLGYGFGGSGLPLGSFDFDSHALSGNSELPGGRLARGAVGNRFRGTWHGRAIIPVPADYLKGLDRRLYERETAPHRRGEEGWPVEVTGRSLATVAGRLPLALWAMMIWSLILRAVRHPRSTPWCEELALWLPVGIILAMTAPALGLLSLSVGILLTAPFGIVIASRLACFLRPGRVRGGWVAAALSLWALGGSLIVIRENQLDDEHIARFNRDLDHLWRKLGLPVLEPRAVAGIDTGERGILYRTFVDSRGVESNYALYVPEDYRGDRPYPLILSLHGYGDRGTTGRQFTAVGLPFTLEYQDIGFLVLCPQGHSGTWEPSGDDARRAMELLAAVQGAYRVDPKRICLNGVSSGGTGVWDLAARFPDRWAAIVPVASAPWDRGQAPLIKHIPCWCFHTRYDGGSPSDEVQGMIEALRAAGGQPRYTEFFDVNHNAWDRAYHMPELYEWLSRQRLP